MNPQPASLDAPLPRVRALPPDADSRARAAASRNWPPVERGGKFVLFVDVDHDKEHAQNTVEIVTAVGEAGELRCCSACGERWENFGRSKTTRSYTHAVHHFFKRHYVVDEN